MPNPCPKCGGLMYRITYYDGPTGGGHKVTCAECGYVTEKSEHWRDDDESGRMSYVRK